MGTSLRVELLSNDSTTSGWKRWNGGVGTFKVVGTFGGATVKLQFVGPDDSTAVDMGTDTTLTANGGGNFEFGPGLIRAEVTGGSPSGLYADAVGVSY